VNTLLLAYAGASLPLMLLRLSNQSLGTVATRSLPSRSCGLVGSIGLVAAVPADRLARGSSPNPSAES
jgi:uncharacterized membrane protein